jgi:hypothetical protein
VCKRVFNGQATTTSSAVVLLWSLCCALATTSAWPPSHDPCYCRLVGPLGSRERPPLSCPGSGLKAEGRMVKAQLYGVWGQLAGCVGLGIGGEGLVGGFTLCHNWDDRPRKRAAMLPTLLRK